MRESHAKCVRLGVSADCSMNCAQNFKLCKVYAAYFGTPFNAKTGRLIRGGGITVKHLNCAST